MKLNESILKTLKEGTIYRNVEDNRDSIEVSNGKLTNTSVGSIIEDFGEFVGITKVKDTYYMIMRRGDSLFIYSFDNGFPYEFKATEE